MRRPRRPLRTRLVVATLLCCVSPAVAGPVILTEFMADNGRTLLDEDGELSDWIEVHNASDAAVSLSGYALTDDLEDPTKWVFPERTLAAREFLVVFASGLDRREPDGPLHTNFRLNAGGEQLALIEPDGQTVGTVFAPAYPEQFPFASFGLPMTAPRTGILPEGAEAAYWVPENADLGLSWTQRDFDDASWLRGTLPLGFDQSEPPVFADVVATDVAEVMLGENASVYVRLSFELPVGDDGRYLHLRIRYQDGFVAYLNGTEVARRNARDQPLWRSTARLLREPARALEEETIDLSGQLALLESGPHVLAFHAFNFSRSSRDFLLSPVLELVGTAEIALEGRSFFDAPSPGWVNAGGAPAVAAPVTFSQESAVLAEPFRLELRHPDPEAEIRYTTNGLVPTLRAPVFHDAITIDGTLTVRTRAYVPNQSPGPVRSQHYVRVSPELADFSSDLPIVIVNNEAARVATGTDLGPGQLFVLEPSSAGRSTLVSTATLASDAGFKVRGSSTAGRPKPSLSLEIWDEFRRDQDAEVLGMPDGSDWVLYGAYNFDRALLRNPFMYELSRQVGRYATRSEFCEVFINSASAEITSDQYMGVYSFMEKIKRGGDRVDVEKLLTSDLSEPEISGGYMLKIDRPDPGDQGFTGAGIGLKWVEPKEEEMERRPEQTGWLLDYFNRFGEVLNGPEFAKLTSAGVPAYEEFIDVESWMDHHILNVFSKNPDAFVLSTYLYKDRSKRIEFGPIWDFDRALGANDDGRAQNPVGWAVFFRIWYTRLFDDPGYWERYVARYAELRSRALRIPNLHAIIDAMADEVREAQVRNFERWALIGADGWQVGQVDRLKQWVTDRITWMDTQLLTTGRQLPMDFDQDSRVNLTDAIATIRSLVGGPGGPCTTRLANARLLDSNGDGTFDLSDGAHVLNYLFLHGPAPALGLSCVPLAACPESCAAP